MIPLSCKESVEYKDDDGTIYVFKPKTGKSEREFCTTFTDLDNKSLVEQMNMRDAFINKILVGFRGPGMPAFPEKDVADLFSIEQKIRIIEMWGKAGDATQEEKKS